MPDAPFAILADAALTRMAREDRARLLSALIARLRDFQMAEDALQEAMTSASLHWGRAGVPHNPQGWLLRVGLRKAIDQLRRTARQNRQSADLALLAQAEVEDTPEIPDDRLRLIFTCCHPALDPKSRVALTLRMLGGLNTAEIARAFLDNDKTMGQRLTRAKTKIATAGIPFAVPEMQDWAERLNSVLAVIYLIFNAGYTTGPAADRDLCAEAIWLARLLDQLRPDQPETLGALALLLISHARRAARIGPDGALVALTQQDRSLWDGAMIAEGLALIERAMTHAAPGPYQIKAAIAACQVQGSSPDWPQILALYDSLLLLEPTPVIHLNRAVALAETGRVEAAHAALASLASELEEYQPYHAVLADISARLGRTETARTAYLRAIGLAASPADAVFLARRMKDQLT